MIIIIIKTAGGGGGGGGGIYEKSSFSNKSLLRRTFLVFSNIAIFDQTSYMIVLNKAIFSNNLKKKNTA